MNRRGFFRGLFGLGAATAFGYGIKPHVPSPSSEEDIIRRATAPLLDAIEEAARRTSAATRCLDARIESPDYSDIEKRLAEIGERSRKRTLALLSKENAL